jgi:hypothetical protein
MIERLSWVQTIDKKVISADEKDLGKVQSLSADYIESKVGKISSKHYFIPRYYVEGFDDDGNIWISLEEKDVKQMFEGKPPTSNHLMEHSYLERKRAILAFYPDFDRNLPPYQTAASAASTHMSDRLAGTVRSSSDMPQTKEETIIPWDRIIDKRAKTTNGEEIGRVASISSDFIDVKGGILDNKHYFIPKYYVEGFDGDNLYLAPVFTTKDQIKTRFLRERPPGESELRDPEYLERIRDVEARYPQFLHGVPWMAKEPSTEIPVDYSGTTYNIAWDKIVHQHVRGSDNAEIGYVERIGDEFIVVRPGTGTSSDVYYIPKTYIRDYDGSQLWVDAASDLVLRFRTESEEPSREELRALALEAPRIRKQSASPPESSTVTRGPSVLWGELKGKEVKTSDGQTLGEIKDISQNYVRIEKGAIKKENRFWIPKFMFDIYDGKNTRLFTNKEETVQYVKSGEPVASEEYARDLDRFKADRGSRIQSTLYDYEEGIRYSSQDQSGYKNIRDLK